jgi:hypothetical protein
MNQIDKMASWSNEINLIGEMRSALSHLNKTEKKSLRKSSTTLKRQPIKV